jgi:hypothetical protein
LMPTSRWLCFQVTEYRSKCACAYSRRRVQVHKL